jgi:hypothetical protein
MLGPSVMFAGPPFITGYAYHAFRRSKSKYIAGAGLVLGVLEVLFLFFMIAMTYVNTDR